MLSLETLRKDLLKKYYDVYDNNIKLLPTLFVQNGTININNAEFKSFDNFMSYVGNHKFTHYVIHSSIQQTSNVTVVCACGKVVLLNNENFNVCNFYETIILTLVNGLYYINSSIQFINEQNK